MHSGYSCVVMCCAAVTYRRCCINSGGSHNDTLNKTMADGRACGARSIDGKAGRGLYSVIIITRTTQFKNSICLDCTGIKG